MRIEGPGPGRGFWWSVEDLPDAKIHLGIHGEDQPEHFIVLEDYEATELAVALRAAVKVAT